MASGSPGNAGISVNGDAPCITRYPAEQDDILKELCNANGVTLGRIQQDGPSFTTLEMFFSGFPKIVGMSHFPNLTMLVLVGQSIQKIEGLNQLTKLNELWICECQLQRIESLDHCRQLQKLYLYSNEISHIENLQHLTNLEVLWLNYNYISRIENISHLTRLVKLNLAENQIERIDETLDANQSLQDLNLSGNKIYSFKDLTNLAHLPNLLHLSLKDPHYSPCPASLLCNYSTHILYHMPNLERLDTYEISTNMLSELAESTVAKKKMFYTMRMKTIQRQLTDILNKVKGHKEKLLCVPYQRLRTLAFAVKQIGRELEENEWMTGMDRDIHNSETESDQDAKETQVVERRSHALMLEDKQQALKDRIQAWERRSKDVEHDWEYCSNKVKTHLSNITRQLVSELESGGNIRFEDGRTTDTWFSSCHDLVLSRFCAVDYKEQSVTGIKIHSITRVLNRILRTRFEEKLAALLEEAEDEYYPGLKINDLRKNLEYLFWVWNPDLPEETGRILEDGFMDPASRLALHKDGAVPLANSVYLCDQARMRHMLSQHLTPTDYCPFRYGQLIICKVYLGKSEAFVDGKAIRPDLYPKVDSLYRAKKKLQECVSKSKGDNPQTPADYTRMNQRCECTSRQCDWHVFDHELILPEYIVNFEYITRGKPPSLFPHVTDWMSGDAVLQSAMVSYPTEMTDSDDDVLHMHPEIRQRPRLVTLSEDILLKSLNLSSLVTIHTLNLHGNGLTKVRYLQSLTLLRKLTLSFNELTRLDELSHMSLEYLDVSFNKIITLEGMKGLGRLKYLDLTWNLLHNTREDLSVLRKHASTLQSLDVRHNNWHKLTNLKLRMIGRLKSLSTFNGQSIQEAEFNAALHVAAGARISQQALLTHSRTDHVPPRSLTLRATSDLLCDISRHKPEKLNESDVHWFVKVTTLNLDNQHITKVSNLDRLSSLRWASFNNNDITRVEGLDNCQYLEELSMEHNCIIRMDGIFKLHSLQRLNLNHNFLTTLDNCGFGSLSSLTHLSLEDNQITSLCGLQKVTSLLELYVGNNRISNVRELFVLKPLSNLVILDLCGNPIVNEVENCRLFVIYHLRPLKALDGITVEVAECNQAKDIFGGRLSSDFVAERIGHSNFMEIRELDFPNCSLRTVDLGSPDHFYNLRSVNLEHNNLTSFTGLVNLVNLRVLCLNHNHVECILPRAKVTASRSKNFGVQVDSTYSPETYTPILENLEVLHLGYNGIKDIAGLQVSRLTSLKALFLQGNEIIKIDGLDGLHDLRELVLDRNKIKGVGELSFVNQWNLVELHMEENRLRELSNLSCLENLHRLYLGANRVQDLAELEKLESLTNLIELSVINNAVSRRLMHRPFLVYRMPNLMMIDGITISEEEKTKAEIYFLEQQMLQPGAIHQLMESSLPGLPQYKTQMPVKVTNMQLTSANWTGPIYYEESPQEQTQRSITRKRNTQRYDNTGSQRGTTLFRTNQCSPTGRNPKR